MNLDEIKKELHSLRKTRNELTSQLTGTGKKIAALEKMIEAFIGESDAMESRIRKSSYLRRRKPRGFWENQIKHALEKISEGTVEEIVKELNVNNNESILNNYDNVKSIVRKQASRLKSTGELEAKRSNRGKSLKYSLVNKESADLPF